MRLFQNRHVRLVAQSNGESEFSSYFSARRRQARYQLGKEPIDTRYVIDGRTSIHLHLILLVGSTTRWISVHEYIISRWERWSTPLFSRIHVRFQLVPMDTLQMRVSSLLLHVTLSCFVFDQVCRCWLLLLSFCLAARRHSIYPHGRELTRPGNGKRSLVPSRCRIDEHEEIEGDANRWATEHEAMESVRRPSRARFLPCPCACRQPSVEAARGNSLLTDPIGRCIDGCTHRQCFPRLHGDERSGRVNGRRKQRYLDALDGYRRCERIRTRRTRSLL